MGNMRFGLEVMLIGFAGVFIALFILFLLLVLLDRFFSKKNNKTPKPDAAGSSKGVEEKPFPAPVAAADTADSEDANELVAVISAALSIYMQKPQASFVIRSINPVRSTNSWAYYGRTRIMDLNSNMGSKRREKR